MMILICIFQMIRLVHSYGWVPLLHLSSYNTKKISEIQVFNKKLVVWTKNNQIIVQDNACIHRLGPLSEGYIDSTTNNLRCSYHGWEFDTIGNAVEIPQKKCGKCNVRKRQKTYITKISCNILWINMDDIIQEFPKHVQNNDKMASDDVFVCELPYSMNTLLENLFDPAHVPFAHHNLQSKRDLASDITSSVVDMDSRHLCIYFEDKTLPNKEQRNGTMEFYAPNHFVLTSLYPVLYMKKLHIFCVPVLPFHTRIFVQIEYNDGVFKKLYSCLPKWLKHLLTFAFFDSDTMLLYKQEYYMRLNKMMQNSTRVYNTPTSSDYSVRKYHKWNKEYPQPWESLIYRDSNVLNEMTREEVFDRYKSHTQNCIYCKTTLRNIKYAQIIIPLIISAHAVEQNSGVELVVAAFIHVWLGVMKTFFVGRDYIHDDLSD